MVLLCADAVDVDDWGEKKERKNGKREEMIKQKSLNGDLPPFAEHAR